MSSMQCFFALAEGVFRVLIQQAELLHLCHSGSGQFEGPVKVNGILHGGLFQDMGELFFQTPWPARGEGYWNHEHQGAEVGIAAQLPVSPGLHSFQNQRARTALALGRFSEDGERRDGACQEMMKADVRKIVAAVDVAGFGTGRELEEHGQHCALGRAVWVIHNQSQSRGFAKQVLCQFLFQFHVLFSREPDLG